MLTKSRAGQIHWQASGIIQVAMGYKRGMVFSHVTRGFADIAI